MVRKYSMIFLKRNISLSLLCAVFCFLPLFVASLFADVLPYDTFTSLAVFPQAILCGLVCSLPILRFRKMIADQEMRYATIFNDTDVEHLDLMLYVSRDWLICAGSCAMYKKHIRTIKEGREDHLTVITVDHRKYAILCPSPKDRKKVIAWADR